MADATHLFPPILQAPPPLRSSPLILRSARRLVPVIYAISVLVFVVDLFRADLLAFGMFYTPMVATAVFYKNQSSVWLLSALAVVMVIIGTFIPHLAPDLPTLLGNRLLSILAIIATAVFIQYARDTQDQLARQAQRIEAAERMKSEVLATLSQEIRMPVHGLLSIVSLMSMSGRPDQRESLRQVRGGADHLLRSINNIIDLTELDRRQFRIEPVDLRAVGRRTVEQAGILTRERQITLHGPEDGEPVLAQADQWAVRRTLESVLAHAIQASPPGGHVSLDFSPGHNQAYQTIALTAGGTMAQPHTPPEHATAGTGEALDAELAEADGAPGNRSATALILAHRLVTAMRGEMVTVDLNGDQALLRISFPAAPS